jgi:uncharacterized membrane protein
VDEPPQDPPSPDEAPDRPSLVGRFVDPQINILRGAQEHVLLPAWRRVTDGEARWPVSLAVAIAITLQILLPDQVANKHRWILPAAASVLLVALIVSNPRRITRQSAALRNSSMALIAVISIGNAWSAGRLIVGLVRGTEGQTAGPLLLTGGAIWLTNVIVFALWYWELDRGGPAARAVAPRPHPDFLFAQMQSPELAPDDWEPQFADYLYLSFTNATAFSPTDVLPLSRWAKLTMMLHSLISLATVALVIARAVNILK